MAYIDDNNDLAAGKGKDPIKELDAELEQLLKELGEMKNEEESPAQTPAQPPVPPKTAPPAAVPLPQQQPIPAPQPAQPPKPPKNRGKVILILVLCVVIIGAAAAGIWAIYGMFSSKISEHLKDTPVATETFTDSELGEVTVKKVDGAALNTYDADNLVKNENGFYEYVTDGKVTSEVGVDLAEYQGDVDFQAVKDSGVDFVILRIGGRYYSDEGALFEDGRFDTYYEQAKAAGLKVGAYFFSQAANSDEATEEAIYVVTKLNGRTLDYPVAFDWETIEDDDARTDQLSGRTITAMAEKFCDTVESKGYKAIVYASTSLMLQSYDFETMKDYEFWLADYREFPNMYYDFAIWQYATDGAVSGIDGTVDLNICFKPY